MLEENQLLDNKYTLLKPFPTRGKSGQTWRALDLNGNEVVIKVPYLKDDFAKINRQKLDIRNEITALTKMQRLSPSCHQVNRSWQISRQHW